MYFHCSCWGKTASCSCCRWVTPRRSCASVGRGTQESTTGRSAASCFDSVRIPFRQWTVEAQQQQQQAAKQRAMRIEWRQREVAGERERGSGSIWGGNEKNTKTWIGINGNCKWAAGAMAQPRQWKGSLREIGREGESSLRCCCCCHLGNAINGFRIRLNKRYHSLQYLHATCVKEY